MTAMQELKQERDEVAADPDATFEECCFAQGIALAVLDVENCKHEGFTTEEAINPRLAMLAARLRQPTNMRCDRYGKPELNTKDPLLFKINKWEAEGVTYAFRALRN